MKYLKFESNFKGVEEKETFFWKIFGRFLMKIIPNSNPDFSKKIDLVYEWLIEYNTSEDYVEREIGLDENGHVIVKMPFKDNYGFWVDTDLKIDYFISKFEAKYIEENDFNEKWNLLLD